MAVKATEHGAFYRVELTDPTGADAASVTTLTALPAYRTAASPKNHATEVTKTGAPGRAWLVDRGTFRTLVGTSTGEYDAAGNELIQRRHRNGVSSDKGTHI